MNFDGSGSNVVYTMDDSNFVKVTYYNVSSQLLVYCETIITYSETNEKYHNKRSPLCFVQNYVFVLDNGGDGQSVIWFLDVTTSTTAASKLQLASTPLALTFVNSLPASSDNCKLQMCSS